MITEEFRRGGDSRSFLGQARNVRLKFVSELPMSPVRQVESVSPLKATPKNPVNPAPIQDSVKLSDAGDADHDGDSK